MGQENWAFLRVLGALFPFSKLLLSQVPTWGFESAVLRHRSDRGDGAGQVAVKGTCVEHYEGTEELAGAPL